MAESTSTPLDSNPDTSDKIAPVDVHLPRISIQFCTQCRWMLRAAYISPIPLPMPILTWEQSQFAQELLSTFSTDLGEVALVPKTGGVFTVTIWHGTMKDGEITTQESILWDRKRDGGFPVVLLSDRSFPYIEVKALKSLVRNVIAPNRDLGHTDRALKKEQGEQESKKQEENNDRVSIMLELNTTEHTYVKVITSIENKIQSLTVHITFIIAQSGRV
ncbi:Pc16g10370 [Penicillium rubens Wisconsin 54-1255]|uniref:Pc16g10370 protein n=1 Tax=Penicillium rubens (strain ATCC 28089 / DSM 1075 / NRRL 1951 / Wisconsin 54-1255) TaxID=500485 RepID=B6H9E2_PENRW|nr:Pc16g10370 [Penicillium rubens Wisconsin 54-1255]